MNILDRFLNYVKIPTTSKYDPDTTPSTIVQKDLAKYLVKELNQMGVDEVYYDDEHCYVYAHLKGNSQADKTIGFIAHMDTSPDAKGENIKPKIIENYDGKDIILNDKEKISPKVFPDLNNHIGKTLITTDGTTLLGADDKAGIAEIMTMVEHFKTTNEPHGDIYLAFTPDEEIGKGTEFFDLNRFKADYAYTVDGVSLGEINYENFNAAIVNIEIEGIDIHPGFAKDKMVNSLLIGTAIVESLPNELPSNTEGYEGFYHLMEMSGNVRYTKIKYIIREHDKEKFKKRKQLLKDIINNLNLIYNNCISLEIKDSCYNMKEVISKDMSIIDNVIKAHKQLNIKPLVIPVRGGTDGARLSFKGLPCPNLGAGGHNFHSVYEYIALEDMENISKILIGIVKSYTKGNDIDKQFIKNKM